MSEAFLTKDEWTSTIRRLDEVRDKEIQRIDEENERQNHRINILEDKVHDLNKLLAAIEKMATHMESIDHELRRQGERLEKLEGRDGDMWRSALKYLLTAVLAALVAWAAAHMGV